MRDRLIDLLDSLHGTPLAGVLGLLAGKDPLKVLRVLALTAFCLPALWGTGAWATLVNQRLMIWFHEGGHGLFWSLNGWWPVGRFLCIAGGSAAQILVPVMFMVAVASVGKRFEASLMFLWLGLNFIDVGRYAGDAQDRALPLIFGLGPEAHDWGNMLTMTHLLWATPVIAGAFWLAGLASFATAVVAGVATAGDD